MIGTSENRLNAGAGEKTESGENTISGESDMVRAEKGKKRHRVLKAAVLPVVVCMTLICWILNAVERLDRWVIRPLAALFILAGIVILLQAEEDWRFFVPAFAVGGGMFLLAPAARMTGEWIERLKKKLIGAVYG